MAIISLTSVPPRFAGLAPVLDSLLAQTASIDEIRLYIPRSYRRFPDFDGSLPEVPRGVRVVRTEEDFGPASKVLHAAQDLAGRETPILFCDDDRVYPRRWAEGLLAAHRTHPDACIATVGRHLHDVCPGRPVCTARWRARIGRRRIDLHYRMRRLRQQWHQKRVRTHGAKPKRRLVAGAGYTEILLGYAGALFRPGFVDAPFYEIPDDVWMVDDIWLSGHLARRGIPIYLPARLDICAKSRTDCVAALRDARFDGRDRDASNRRAISYFQQTYGVWT